MSLLYILIIVMIFISIYYIYAYACWQNSFSFSDEEMIKYRKLLCEKLGLDYRESQSDSIDSLEKAINQEECNLNNLKRSIKAAPIFILFNQKIIEKNITLRRMFFYKRERWSKASRYPSDPVYKESSLRIFYFIPIWKWKKIDYGY